MPAFLRFLLDNPILLFVLVAWAAGAIGNAAKAAKRAREQRSLPPPSAGRPPVRPASERFPTVQTGRPRPAPRPAEEVAAEMRRILGMDVETRPVERPPAPVVMRPKRREVFEPERAPAPAVPTTQDRRLELRADSHVGEGMQRRQAPQSGKVGGSSIGTLGGRVHGARKGRGAGSSLVNLSDLKRAFVVTEILGAPLALRGPNELRGG